MAEPTRPRPMPASREPVSLLSVDRAISELRRGRMVVLRAAEGRAVLALAAEAVTPETLGILHRLAVSQPTLAITSRRAAVLNIGASGAPVVRLKAEPPLNAEHIRTIADPVSPAPDLRDLSVDIEDAESFGAENAAVQLTKIARLLPAAVAADVRDPAARDLDDWARRQDLMLLDCGDVFQYEHTQARTLARVAEAQVPLEDAEQSRIIAFRPLDGGIEHLAIVIGEPSTDQPVLTRLHSECFTGDLLGSLRCDCGDQLRGAIQEISRTGSGVLLYLAQEGRGIGLVNKLRAYKLQDSGFDTMDANLQLGFDVDERVYLPAAQMLRALGFTRVKLLTNNPEKVDGLAAAGVAVVERVGHSFPSNRHNEVYLQTKRAKGGHLF